MPFIWALPGEAILPQDDSKQIPQIQSTLHCTDCGIQDNATDKSSHKKIKFIFNQYIS